MHYVFLSRTVEFKSAATELGNPIRCITGSWQQPVLPGCMGGEECSRISSPAYLKLFTDSRDILELLKTQDPQLFWSLIGLVLCTLMRCVYFRVHYANKIVRVAADKGARQST